MSASEIGPRVPGATAGMLLLGGGLRVHPAVAEEPQHRVVIHGRGNASDVQRRAHGGQAGSLLLGAAGGVHHLVADCLLRARDHAIADGGREARRERVAGDAPNRVAGDPPERAVVLTTGRAIAGRACRARGRARSPRGPTSPSPSRASCGVNPRARRGVSRPQTPCRSRITCHEQPRQRESIRDDTV